MLGGIRKRLAEMAEARRQRRHHEKMLASMKPDEPGYQEYLKVQLDRTLSKSGAKLPERAKYFMDHVDRVVALEGKRVLCVGCRNVEELEYLRQRGVAEAVGVDLYSEHPSIVVMDMHDLRFGDGEFDLVYSSHSLEHALKPEVAARQFMRVVKPGGAIAIEVPVEYETRGSDLQDYGSVAGVAEMFGERTEEVVWSEHARPGEENCFEPMAVVRVVMRMREASKS